MKLKLIPVLMASVLLVSFSACKKKKAEMSSTSTVTKVELTGTAAQNLIQVFGLGVAALKSNSEDPAAAAKQLTGLLAAYNVADLRAKSRAAKDAGTGATAEEKAQYKALKAEYKTLAKTVGGKNPTAFNSAHASWVAAFGVK